MRTTRNHRILLGLVGLGLALKLAWLGTTELAHDEPFTVYWALRPMHALWAMLATENNPPLYFLLMKAWSAVVPLDAAWLRVPAAVASALVVWPLFLLAQHLAGLRAGVAVSLLFTFSTYHYAYAHEVRAYALFTLLSVAAMWLLVRPDERGNSTPWLCAVSILLVYTHFFGWLLLGVQALCLLLPAYRPRTRRYLVALSAAVTSYLPYAAIFLGRMDQSVSEGTWLEAPVPEEVYNMLWRWSNAPVLAVLFLVAIGVATWRTRANGMGLALIWAFVPLIGMFAVSYAVPMYLDRYLVYAAPGFVLALGIGLAGLTGDRRISTALLGAAVLGMACTFRPWQDSGRHPSRVVEQARTWQEEQRPILIAPGHYAPTFAWHWDRHMLASPEPLAVELDRRNIHLVDGPAGPLPLEAEAVVLIDAGPGQHTATQMRSMWPQVEQVEADRKVQVYLFRR